MKYFPPLLVAILTASALFLMLPAAALACSLVGSGQPMEILDEEPTDEASFPDPVALESGDIRRADRRMTDSCSDLAWFNLDLNGYDDEYGLIFELEGDHPDGLSLPEEALRFSENGASLTVAWGDEHTRTEPLDITITAQWIDEYGRTGPASDPIHIVDNGAGFGGCATTTGGGPSSALLLVVIGLFAVRRLA